jgi:hypothetical protein
MLGDSDPNDQPTFTTLEEVDNLIDNDDLVNHMNNNRTIVNELNTNSESANIDDNRLITINFSEMIINFREQNNNLSIIIDYIHLYTESMKKLSQYETPYMFKDCKNNIDVYKKLISIYDNILIELETIKVNSNETELKLSNVRKIYDNLFSRLTNYHINK